MDTHGHLIPAEAEDQERSFSSSIEDQHVTVNVPVPIFPLPEKTALGTPGVSSAAPHHAWREPHDFLKPAVGANGAGSSEGSSAEDKPAEAKPISFFQLFRYADNLDKLAMLFAFIGAVGNGALLPMFSLLFGEFTNAFGSPDMSVFFDVIKGLSLKFLYLGLGAGVAAFFDQSLWTWTGNRQTNRLRSLYLASVLGQDIAFFDTSTTGTGGMLQGLNQDSGDVQMAMSEKLGQLIKNASTFVTGFALAFAKGWDMTLVMLGCIPLMGVVGAFMTRTISRSTQKQNMAYSKAAMIAQQSIAQIRTVAAYTQEPRMVQDYSRALAEPMQAGIHQAWVMGLTLGSFQLIIFGSFAVALVYGAFRVAAGAYTGGDVMNVLIAVLLGGFAIMQGAPNIQYVIKGKVSGARMFKLIERRPEIDIDSEVGEEPKAVVGELVLKDVTFAYPARLDVPVFSNFNLVVAAGKTMALVGSSGSGKSTVVGLIERFYDPQAGVVLLDGVDLRKLKLSWLRNQVGLVSQEPTLFGTTVRENIAMGRPGATHEEVEAAAKAANAHVFVERLPEGYDTHVGERGMQLSGGQKQRIAIARAVLKNPRILLLDEATSALDTGSERLVQAALDSLAVGRTSVVVAHRLSTIRNADSISVLSDGRVLEQGSHEELLRDPAGAYTALVKMQMRHGDAKTGAAGAVTMTVVEEEEELDEDEALMHRLGSGASAGLAKESVHSAQTVKPSPLEAVVVSGDPSAKLRTPADVLLDQQAKKKDALKEMEKLESQDADVSMRRLVKLNLPEWHYGIMGVIASAVAGGTSPAFAFLFASMITIFYGNSPAAIQSAASFYAGMLIVVGVAAFLAVMMQQACFGTMGQRLALRVREQLFKAILRQEVGWFDRESNSSGALASMLSNDATHVRGAVADVAGLLIQNLTTLAAGYVLALVFDWRMALLVTGILPLMVIAQSVEVKYQMGTTGSADELYAGANQAASESISGIRVVQSYNLQQSVIARYDATMEDTNKQVKTRSLAIGFSSGFAAFMMFATYSLVIYFGGYEIVSGLTTFDNMLKAFMSILFAAIGMAQAAAGFGDVGKAKVAVKSIFPIIDRQPLIGDKPDADANRDSSAEAGGAAPSGSICKSGVEGINEVSGSISFRDIDFKYPSRMDVTVFKGFSLEVPAGRTMALVGESGSGKSTVVGLIERFYDPQAGAVLLDGVDIRQYKLRWLRQQIALVSQEPLLFSGSILDNIRFGSTNATMEEVLMAAEAANARAFIERLPEAYDTKVGEAGIQLSGGQKQRIAIARAIIKNPKVLLLDEATSALDANSEAEVQVALDRIMVGRTSLVIAHRLSTIRNADCIAVVYRGVILEKGSHEELLAVPDGSYARLVDAQGQSQK